MSSSTTHPGLPRDTSARAFTVIWFCATLSARVPSSGLTLLTEMSNEMDISFPISSGRGEKAMFTGNLALSMRGLPMEQLKRVNCTEDASWKVSWAQVNVSCVCVCACVCVCVNACVCVCVCVCVCACECMNV